MKTNNNRCCHSILFGMAVFVVSFSSCREDFDFDEAKHNYTDTQKKICESIERIYGDVSRDISWINVSEGSARVSLQGMPSDNYTVQIFTTDPRQDRTDCYMIAEAAGLSNTSSLNISYDYPSGLNYVYVQAVGDTSELCYTVRVNTGTEDTAVLADDVSPEQIKAYGSMCYRLCFETYLTKDSTYLDFDYNDVVFDIEYVRGRNYAYVKPKAVGCNMPAEIYFNRGNIGKNEQKELLMEELHAAFGIPPYYNYNKKKNIYIELNTGVNKGTLGPECLLELRDLAGCSIIELIKRFSVKFGSEEEKIKEEICFVDPEIGSKLGMAFCVPQPSWKWQDEGMRIDFKYTNFRNWIKDNKRFWYDATWLIANNREHEDPTENSPYGQEMTIVDNYISLDQLLPYANYYCTLVIRVSGVTSPSSMSIIKYPDSSYIFAKNLKIPSDGIYEVELTPTELYRITETQTTGNGGLKLIYNDFVVEGVYIK